MFFSGNRPKNLVRVKQTLCNNKNHSTHVEVADKTKVKSVNLIGIQMVMPFASKNCHKKA